MPYIYISMNEPAKCLNWPLDMLNTLRPRQNGRHFTDDIFKCIFLNENISILTKISLNFVPKGRINNIQALVQIMAWCWQATNHYLNQWWLVYWRIYALLGLNELTLLVLRRKYSVNLFNTMAADALVPVPRPSAAMILTAWNMDIFVFLGTGWETSARPLANASENLAGRVENRPGQVEFCIGYIQVGRVPTNFSFPACW